MMLLTIKTSSIDLMVISETKWTTLKGLLNFTVTDSMDNLVILISEIILTLMISEQINLFLIKILDMLLISYLSMENKLILTVIDTSIEIKQDKLPNRLLCYLILKVEALKHVDKHLMPTGPIYLNSSVPMVDFKAKDSMISNSLLDKSDE